MQLRIQETATEFMTFRADWGSNVNEAANLGLLLLGADGDVSGQVVRNGVVTVADFPEHGP